MKVKSRNSYYEYNEIHNMDFINETVDGIMDEKVQIHHCDIACRDISNAYKNTINDVLDIDLKFKSSAETDYVYNGRNVFPDFVGCNYSDYPEYGGEIYSVVEFLTYDIAAKLPSLFNSVMAVTVLKNLPCIPYVVSNKNYGCDGKVFNVGHCNMYVHLRAFDDEKISKILNTLSKRDYINEEISQTDFINFLFCIAFSVGESGKDFLRQSVDITCSLEKLDSNHRIHLFSVLKENIKSQFSDDLVEKRRLITMALKSMPQDVYEEMSYLDVITNDRDKLRSINERIVAEKDEIAKLVAENERVIAEKDEEIANLKKVISDLQNQHPESK